MPKTSSEGWTASSPREIELAGTVRQLEALHRADSAMHESLRPQDVFQAMAGLAVDFLGADRSIFGTADPEGGSVIRAVRGVSDTLVSQLNAIFREQAPDRFAAAPPTVQLVEDVQSDPEL